MPKNEDGEFELVLGNKQLLSMFFVVVVLLAVFFVMGYIVGRSSAPVTAAEPSRKPEAKSVVAESSAPKPSETPAASTPAATAPAPEKAPETPATPAASVTAETAKPQPAPKAKAEKAEAKADQSKAEKARPQGQSNQPVAGSTYLQLSATAKRDADAMVEELRKNNFLALDVEVPEKPGTFRVLVGPIPTGDVNKTKTELQSKSFPGNAAIIKKF